MPGSLPRRTGAKELSLTFWTTVGLTIPGVDGWGSPGGGGLVGGDGVLLRSGNRLIFSAINKPGILREGNPSFSIPTAMSVYPGKSINFSLWPEVMNEFSAET